MKKIFLLFTLFMCCSTFGYAQNHFFFNDGKYYEIIRRIDLDSNGNPRAHLDTKGLGYYLAYFKENGGHQFLIFEVGENKKINTVFSQDLLISGSNVTTIEDATVYPIDYRLIGKGDGDIKGTVNAIKGNDRITVLIEFKTENGTIVRESWILATTEYRDILTIPFQMAN